MNYAESIRDQLVWTGVMTTAKKPPPKKPKRTTKQAETGDSEENRDPIFAELNRLMRQGGSR